MQSKRKRAAERREETVAELLQAYRNEQEVPRGGGHVMLRWLVMARCYEPLETDDMPDCPMDAANAVPFIPTVHQVEDMEQIVAHRVMTEERHRCYLEYAAYFFHWWSHIAAIAATPTMDAGSTPMCTWLGERDVERSLVVPDVRRGAIKLSQRMELRAGEMQLAGGRLSLNNAIQTMRTGERCNLMHHTLMYGTLTDIYQSRLLDCVYFTIVTGRYRGRLNFDWAENVLVLPHKELVQCTHQWPLVYVHGTSYIVHWHGKHAVCASAPLAYTKWLDVCLQLGGVIGGRYDVRKCTI